MSITENGVTAFEKPCQTSDEEDTPLLIHRYTLAELHDYALHVPVEELTFIRRAFALNMALCRAGLASGRTTYVPYLLKANGGQLIAHDERRTASLLCNAAIEARVLGLPEPAMSVTGMICDGRNQGAS